MTRNSKILVFMQLTTQGVLTPWCPLQFPLWPEKKYIKQRRAKPQSGKKETAKIICEFFFFIFFLCFIFEGQGRCAYGIIMWREGKREEERWSPAEFGGERHQKILMHDKSFILFHLVFGFWFYYFCLHASFLLCVFGSSWSKRKWATSSALFDNGKWMLKDRTNQKRKKKRF